MSQTTEDPVAPLQLVALHHSLQTTTADPPKDVGVSASLEVSASVQQIATLGQPQNIANGSSDLSQHSPPRVDLEGHALLGSLAPPDDSSLITFARRVKKHLIFPLLPLPDLQQSRGKAISEDFTPRKSARIASRRQRPLVANRVELVLAEKMGISPGTNLLVMDAISKYQELFNSQLHHR